MWKDMHDPQAPIETHVLRLAIDKARTELPWQPRLTAHEAIHRTAAWFKAFAADPARARPLCESDLMAVEQAARASGVSVT